MRLLCVASLVAAAACGPFGGSPGVAGGAGVARATSSPPSIAAGPAGPVAILLQPGPGATYTISLVADGGGVIGAASARLRTPQPATYTGPGMLPVFSASDTRVYYLDGDDAVRFLALDGSRGLAARVPGGARVQAAFAVSPDDQRIAVATLDASAQPATTRLYVEDLAGGGNHVELPPINAWPVGWHAGDLVLAVGSRPTRNLDPNPYGTFGGYRLVDAGTGVGLGAVECLPAGPLTAAGTACLSGGAAVLVTDFAGQARALPGPQPPAPVESAAEAPDGARVALCCPSGLLELWDVAGGALTSLGAAPLDGYGWIDATHLLAAGRAGEPARVMDVASGGSVATAASGQVVGRVPGGL